MANTLQGKVFKVLPEQSGQGQNGEWKKQDFVIETEEQYPEKVCFTAWGAKTDEVKLLKIGDKVEVSFNLSSREFKEKWYNTIRAYKIDRKTFGKPIQQAQNTVNNHQDTTQEAAGEEDDLPF